MSLVDITRIMNFIVTSRSYHHLFPVEPYEELNNEGQAQSCFACIRNFTDLDKQVIFTIFFSFIILLYVN